MSRFPRIWMGTARWRQAANGPCFTWVLPLAVTVLVAPASAWAQQATVTGEVRRVDAAAGTVTLKQGEIKELDLPAMTLVYQIAPALLQKIKAGDKVRFTATRQDGKYVVTAIDKAVF
jgi:Cu(I)/Ag(I) efflux system protein CusF